MKKGLWKKGIVLGIIILFFGAGVTPSISGDFQNNNEVEEKIEIDDIELNSVDIPLAHFDDEWDIKQVGTDEIIGYNSIAVGSDGIPQISYYHKGTGNLNYAKKSGSSWDVITIDSVGSGIENSTTDIALDSNNYAHISYYKASSRDLKYAYYDGTWHNDTIDSDGDCGYYNSIAVDENGNPHISYYDASNDELNYAYYDGTQWHEDIEVPESTGIYIGRYNSIALDSNDNPHIAYYAYLFPVESHVRYAKKTSSGWDITSIESKAFPYRYWHISLDLDSNNHAHVSYIDIIANEIYYANNKNGDWNNTKIYNNAWELSFTSIAADSNNNPRISFSFLTNLRYKYYDGSTWHESIVDSDGFKAYNSIDVESGNLVHISFYEIELLSDSKLYHAKKINEPPNTPSIPSGPTQLIAGESGTYSTSATDPDGDQIQYRFDWGNGVISDWTDLVNSGESASKSYSWSNYGSYEIKSQAKDEQGEPSGWSNPLTVKIFGCNAGGPYYGFKNYYVQFQGSAGYGQEPYTYSWNFGDGQSSSQQNPQHSYTSTGLYTATLTVTDDNGKTHSDTATVQIKNLPIVVETLLVLSGVSPSWDGARLSATIPFNVGGVQNLIDFDGSVPGNVDLDKPFNGSYDFNTDWNNTKIKIDLYPDTPNDDKMTLAAGIDLSMNTYAPFGGDLSLYGGARGNFSKVGDQFEWNLSIYLDGDLTFPIVKIQGTIWFIPVYAKVDINFEAGVDFYLSSPTEWNQDVFNGATGYIGLGFIVHAGIGICDVIGLGLYADVNGRWKFTAPEVAGSLFDSFEATFAFGAYGQLLGMEGRWEWYRTNWSTNKFENDNVDEGWDFMIRNYSNASWVNDSDGVLINDSFPQSNPYIDRNANDDRIMVWVQDDLDKGDKGDGLDIWYSIWDENLGENGSWKQSQRITDDNFAQSNPTVAVLDNGNALCVFNWLNESAADKTVEEIFSQNEIGYSYWNGVSWTEPKYVVNGGTTNHNMDMYPVVKADGNDATVVWLCDDDANVFTVNDRVMYASFWDSNSWINTKIISTENIISAPVSFAFKNDQRVCVYAVDENGNLSNRSDQNIYMTTFSNDKGFLDNTEQITNTGRNANPNVNFINDTDPSISWIEENENETDLTATILYINNTNARADPEIVETGIKQMPSASLFRSESNDFQDSMPLIGWNDGVNICFKKRFEGGWEDTQTLHSSPELVAQTAWDYDGTGEAVYAVFIEKEEYDSHHECQMRIAGMGQMLTPVKPTIPSGVTSGYINENYEYSTSSVDPTPSGELWYQWDWGDGDVSGWLGPYGSGETVTESHRWTDIDTYIIKVRAKNSLRYSNWSEPLTVTMISHPPSSPYIKGETRGTAGEIYEYSFESGDPERDEIKYYVDWGDDTTTGWIGPYESGEKITLEKRFNKRGTYEIRAKAKDNINLGESDWSSLEVTMPKNQLLKNMWFLQWLLDRYPQLENLFHIIIANFNG